MYKIHSPAKKSPTPERRAVEASRPGQKEIAAGEVKPEAHPPRAVLVRPDPALPTFGLSNVMLDPATARSMSASFAARIRRRKGVVAGVL